MRASNREDVKAIKAMIERQFECLTWSSNSTADWEVFARDFVVGAPLYPAARPAAQQSVDSFIERMQQLAATKLQSFDETMLGTEVRVFGNVAVAVAACEIVENASEVNRSVEMLLLVKTDGEWRIAAQAWDTESDGEPIPTRLLQHDP